MTISKEINDTAMVISIGGRLDTSTAPQLENEIKQNISGITELTINMSELDYISSAGLRVLLSAQKIMNKQGNMTIKNVSKEIAEIFEVTGFDDILNIE